MYVYIRCIFNFIFHQSNIYIYFIKVHISLVCYLSCGLNSFMALYSCPYHVTGKGLDVTFNENPKLVGCELGLDVTRNLFVTLYTVRKRP